MSADNVTPIRSGIEQPPPPPSKPPKKARRPRGPSKPVATRIEEERTRLFGAMGVVGCVRQALKRSGSPIDGAVDQCAATDAWTALDAAYALLDDIAGKLNEISGV
jgi:hypothetical protein